MRKGIPLAGVDVGTLRGWLHRSRVGSILRAGSTWLRGSRLGLVVMALLVGVGAGLGAVGFRYLISGCTCLANGYQQFGQQGRAPLGTCFPIQRRASTPIDAGDPVPHAPSGTRWVPVVHLVRRDTNLRRRAARAVLLRLVREERWAPGATEVHDALQLLPRRLHGEEPQILGFIETGERAPPRARRLAAKAADGQLTRRRGPRRPRPRHR